jgi:hypothetical protein
MNWTAAMAKNSQVKIPKRIMGAKVPKDIRKNLKRLLRSIEGHGVTSLAAVAVSTWLMSKLGQGNTVEKNEPAKAH